LKERTRKRAASAEDYPGVDIQLSEEVLLVCVLRQYDIIVLFCCVVFFCGKFAERLFRSQGG
jgi:hypothetical protein